MLIGVYPWLKMFWFRLVKVRFDYRIEQFHKIQQLEFYSDPSVLKHLCHGRRAVGAAGNSAASRVWKGVNTAVLQGRRVSISRRPFFTPKACAHFAPCRKDRHNETRTSSIDLKNGLIS